MLCTICGANKGVSPSLMIVEKGEENTRWNLVNTLTQPNLTIQEKRWVHKQCQAPGAGQTTRLLFEAKEWCDRMLLCWTCGAAAKDCKGSRSPATNISHNPYCCLALAMAWDTPAAGGTRCIALFTLQIFWAVATRVPQSKSKSFQAAQFLYKNNLNIWVLSIAYTP